MVLMNVEVFARRLPYILFVFVSALLILTFALFWPTGLTYEGLSLPYLVVLFCLIVYADAWATVLRVRVKAVGLPHSRWLIVLYGLCVYFACGLLWYLVSIGRFLVPGLFVLLNMPLVILKGKSSVSVAPPIE
jgi:hypothetical protein